MGGKCVSALRISSSVVQCFRPYNSFGDCIFFTISKFNPVVEELEGDTNIDLQNFLPML